LTLGARVGDATLMLPEPTIDALRGWLLGRALPLWVQHGIDRRAGAFHEWLAPGHDGCDAPFRRLRVVARQITAFSLAHRAGVAGADEAAALGIAFLSRHASLPEGGYAWQFDLSNRPIDTRRDLYDHAFVLLALSEATAVLPAAPLRRRALTLLEFLDRHMRHPQSGWAESIPPALPRRQNPHMHLLEALLAASGAFGDPIFLTRAGEVVALFLDRLLDAQTGALPEFFGDTWQVERQDGVFVWEPGHHYEWAWLLRAYAKRAGPDERRDGAASRLLHFARTHGVHPSTGDLIDGAGSDGVARAHSARLWPQAERLRLEFACGGAGRTQAAVSLAAYLQSDGLWHERRNAAGGFIPGPSPASSLYHITTGILGAAHAVPD
jgi:mannose/cellobiose epimerase-like protein (N-acyl-D-glucosamine 2-epimerase family)